MRDRKALKPLNRIAMLSVHGCPLASLGEGESGGMSVYVRELSLALGRRGFSVDIFTRWHEPHGLKPTLLGEGVRLIHLQCGPWENPGKNSLYNHLTEFLGRIMRFSADNDRSYDLIHSHYWLSGRVGHWLQERWGLPHIITFHTLGEVKNHSRLGERETSQRIEEERSVVASADQIIAPHIQEKHNLVRFYRALLSKVKVIPCGVDLELFHPMDKGQARKRLGLHDAKIVLFVGRMDPLKGIDILLRGVAKLDDRKGLRVLVVGGNLQKDKGIKEMGKLALDLGIDGQVSFLGAVPQERLPLYYSAADVCIVPSYYESFCLVALEALACGTPVIASRVGGLTGIVRDGETGFLIPLRCPDPFSERLELLLSNEGLRQRFGMAARDSVQKFSWSIMADRVAEVYKGLMAPKGKVA